MLSAQVSELPAITVCLQPGLPLRADPRLTLVAGTGFEPVLALADGFTVRRPGFPRMSLDVLVAPDLWRRFQSVPPHLGLFRTSCDNLVTSAVDTQSSPAFTPTPCTALVPVMK